MQVLGEEVGRLKGTDNTVFGEVHLLHSSKCNASVYAVGEVYCWKVGHEEVRAARPLCSTCTYGVFGSKP